MSSEIQKRPATVSDGEMLFPAKYGALEPSIFGALGCDHPGQDHPQETEARVSSTCVQVLPHS